MRNAEIDRKTKETHVQVSVSLDGKGSAVNQTRVRFLDHMLNSLATHSLIDLEVKAEGDLQHHIVEDVALALGSASTRRWGIGVGFKDSATPLFPWTMRLPSRRSTLSDVPSHQYDCRLKEQ